MSDQPLTASGPRARFESAERAFETRTPASILPASPSGARDVSRAGEPATVQAAISAASRATGVDFGYLVAQAQVESAMDPDARARTSSATGLYQFIDSTWLATMQRHGARFGLGDLAGQITLSPGGSATVSDPATREAILALRSDPQIASLMAAGLAQDNRAHLLPILGREPTHGELYLAHFLGAGGAGRFLTAMAANPDQSAADLFRRPAAANRPVFYEPGGTPRSLAGVMSYLEGRLDRALAQAPGQPPAPAAFTPPPYIIADEAVFGPASSPAITGARRPTLSAAPTLPLAQPGSRSSMSGLLQTTFGDLGGNSAASSQPAAVRRAYDQLRALGF